MFKISRNFNGQSIFSAEKANKKKNGSPFLNYDSGNRLRKTVSLNLLKPRHFRLLQQGSTSGTTFSNHITYSRPFESAFHGTFYSHKTSHHIISFLDFPISSIQYLTFVRMIFRQPLTLSQGLRLLCVKAVKLHPVLPATFRLNGSFLNFISSIISVI